MAEEAGQRPGQNGALSPIVTIVGWWILPSLFSSLVLRVFYSLFPSRRPVIPRLPPRPPDLPASVPLPVDPETHAKVTAGNAKVLRHRRRAQIFCIAAYLVYGVVRVYLDQSGSNYYARLGLPIDALGPAIAPPGSGPDAVELELPSGNGGPMNEAAFKSHWRKLARVAHPDKFVLPTGLSVEEAEARRRAFEGRFLGMREAYDVLGKRHLRWAYERFGPEVVHWKDCRLPHEYMRRGLIRSSPYYVVSAITLVLFSALRGAEPGSFWRWYILAASVVLEATLLMYPPHELIPLLFSFLFPNRLPYEHVLLLRQLTLAGGCAATHIGSIFSSPADGKPRPWWELKGSQREREMLRMLRELGDVAEKVRMANEAVARDASTVKQMDTRALVEGKLLAEGRKGPPSQEEVAELIQYVEKVIRRHQAPQNTTNPEDGATRSNLPQASAAKIVGVHEHEEEKPRLDPDDEAAEDGLNSPLTAEKVRLEEVAKDDKPANGTLGEAAPASYDTNADAFADAASPAPTVSDDDDA